MLTLLDYLLNGVTTGAVYAAVALSVVVVFRATGIINFAQGSMAVLTTFVCVEFVNLGMGYWLAGALTVVIGFLAGAVVDGVFIRPLASRPDISAVMVTFGLYTALTAVIGLVWGPNFRAFPTAFSNSGIAIGHDRLAFSRNDLFIIVSVVVLTVLVAVLLLRTNLGLRMRATAANREVARLLGIRVRVAVTVGWGIAGSIGAVSGVLISPQIQLYPSSFDSVLLIAFVGAVLGGLNSFTGSCLGALAIGVLLSLVGGYVGTQYQLIAGFLALLVTLLMKPSGLFGGSAARKV